jgi:excisionase family DNA binding protein
METLRREGGLLTLNETMALLRVSRSTMYRLIRRRELPVYKIGRRWMFDIADLRRFMASRRLGSMTGEDGDTARAA